MGLPNKGYRFYCEQIGTFKKPYIISVAANYLFDLCRATNNKNNGFFIIKNDRKFRVVIDRIEEIKIT